MNAEVTQESEAMAAERPVCGPRIDRLQRLLAHMEAAPEVRGNRRFDFGTYRTACGTAGCMAGELPAIWPEEWTLVRCDFGSFPYLKGDDKRRDVSAHLSEWFGIEWKTARRIFYPAEFNRLTGLSSRGEVVENLRQVIAELEAKARDGERAAAEFRDRVSEGRRAR
jgi:hypothetical protein